MVCLHPGPIRRRGWLTGNAPEEAERRPGNVDLVDTVENGAAERLSPTNRPTEIASVNDTARGRFLDKLV
jgi:hypothetical protein